jgi:hypothetical protein
MMRTLAETGNGWMTFKDASNLKANQTARPENVVHLSNLCTEILEVTNQARPRCATSDRSTLVGDSFEMARWIDYDRIAEVVHLAVPISRPGRRHQLLSHRRIRELQRQVASGRARPHGSARRVLQAALAVRLRPRLERSPHGSAKRSTSTP